jgi:hypothetical protein
VIEKGEEKHARGAPAHLIVDLKHGQEYLCPAPSPLLLRRERKQLLQ